MGFPCSPVLYTLDLGWSYYLADVAPSHLDLQLTLYPTQAQPDSHARPAGCCPHCPPGTVSAAGPRRLIVIVAGRRAVPPRGREQPYEGHTKGDGRCFPSSGCLVGQEGGWMKEAVAWPGGPVDSGPAEYPIMLSADAFNSAVPQSKSGFL